MKKSNLKEYEIKLGQVTNNGMHLIAAKLDLNFNQVITLALDDYLRKKLRTGDYNAFTTLLVTIDNWKKGMDNEFQIPSNQLDNAITQGGSSYFCIREYDHDVLNVDPGQGVSESNFCFWSEEGGTGDDPQLTVTWTAPPAEEEEDCNSPGDIAISSEAMSNDIYIDTTELGDVEERIKTTCS